MDTFFKSCNLQELKDSLEKENSTLISYIALDYNTVVVISSTDPNSSELKNTSFNNQFWIFVDGVLHKKNNSNSFVFDYVYNLLNQYAKKWLDYIGDPKCVISVGSQFNLHLNRPYGFNNYLNIELPLFCFNSKFRVHYSKLIFCELREANLDSELDWKDLHLKNFSIKNNIISSSFKFPRFSIPYIFADAMVAVPAILNLVELQRFDVTTLLD